MRFATAAVAASGLATLAAAIPTTTLSSRYFHMPGSISRRAEQKTAAQIVVEIAPKSADCSTPSEVAPDECSTAENAAPHLINAMFNNGIYEPAQIAAILALQALECGEYRFNRNHFPEPGRPGQGTRNMQMFDFNYEFAMSKPELASQVPTGDASAFTDEQKNQVLALVMPDEYSFESAAWFLKTKCEPAVLDQLASDPDAGFLTYMNDCVGVDGAHEERQAYWTAAKTAFGI
jgi:hypothetical protein